MVKNHGNMVYRSCVTTKRCACRSMQTQAHCTCTRMHGVHTNNDETTHTTMPIGKGLFMSGMFKVLFSSTFNMGCGIRFRIRLCCMMPTPGLRFYTRATAVFRYSKAFSVVLWCVESEYEHEIKITVSTVVDPRGEFGPTSPPNVSGAPLNGAPLL